MNTQNGYSDYEGSSLSFTRTDGANRTAMQFDEVLTNRQPKPQSGMPPGDSVVGLAKALEDVGQEIRTNALASVTDHNLNAGFNSGHSHLHSPAFRRELDGV